MRLNRTKKRITSGTVLVLTAVLGAGAAILGGCASGFPPGDGAAGDTKPYVALVTKSTTSAFWQSVFTGAAAAATEYNLSITCNGPDREEDYETQNQMIDQAVDDGAKVIVFSAVDFNANADAINRAERQGVKIVVIDSDVNSTRVSSHIGTDNYSAGDMAGAAALTCEDEELYIGIVNYGINTANGQQREQGFRDRVAMDSRIKDIVTINVVSTTEDARAGTKELLQQRPEINVIATFNEWTSLGVGWAIRDMELADETMVVAFDSNVVSVGMLETGEVDALIVQNPYAMGYLGVETAYNLLNGQKVDNNGLVDTATILVTRENMYLEKCQRALFAFD